MRVLVTRPAVDAARTAEKLQNLGHEPICLPLTVIEPTDVPPPPGQFEAVAVTSRNAASFVRVVNTDGRPVYAVGEGTAAALRAAGVTAITNSGGTAGALASALAKLLPTGARVLYPCGEPRKPDFERILTGTGHVVLPWVVYRALEASISANSDFSGIEAVLHFSRASASRFMAMLGRCRSAAQLAGVPQLCLSADVAAALCDLPSANILIAAKPDESSLFSLLAICRS